MLKSPPWWCIGLLVAGFFAIIGGRGFAFPVPAWSAIGGFALLALGVVAIYRRMLTGKLEGGKTGTWNARNLGLTVGWIAAVYAAMWVTETLLRDSLGDGMAGLVAAVPATALFAGYLGWALRIQYGRR
ncbi:hypothetical protein EV191_1011470 [Tamaricihabitans halophyticus]|uniref:Uncharacterized protein n=1 Tax=Tamaricihabitans halophyticus TaxID=1262583 RepID=A0A4R2R4K7_9PSEU|nr:hypothetical protein [Tamaricihabitans halophyticus]TCP57513.1 hypothetical protein EV191_1011470 [Tamaricihabitans halophyticus]